MRNPIHVLRSLEKNASNQNYKYRNLYRNLYNPEFYWLAYNRIAKSQGGMTAGVDGQTLDNMSVERIDTLVERIKTQQYHSNPARREYIAKKNNPAKKRPLGIPSTEDKLVQEVARMLLEAIYEPTFAVQSHGFRPKRSCHTALLEVQRTFTGTRWIIEGDIQGCFDNFDHQVLIGILRKRIEDEKFIQLMWKMLKAGYMEQWEHHNSFSGTPQGSGVSPILANIYMNELDNFLLEYAQKYTHTDKCHNPCCEYNAADYAVKRAKAKIAAAADEDSRKKAVRELKTAQQARCHVHYYPVKDTAMNKLVFNRYADDFVVGVTGSKADALRIKQDIGDFLANKLHLTLSVEKTKVTHSSELVRYLGYDFCVSRSEDMSRDKNGVLKRSHYGTVQLDLPKEKWVGKLLELGAMKIVRDKGNDRDFWKPMHRGKLQNVPDVEIVRKYNSETRGLYNYYRLASNVSVLNQFDYIMNGSLHKTFAFKYRTKASSIREKYMVNGIFTVDYETKQGKKRCEVYHEGFTQKKTPLFGDVDVLPQSIRLAHPNWLAARVKAGVCELCGKDRVTVHMHHVRSLKNLKGTTPCELKMLDMRRRSIALCPDCFAMQHNTK